MIEIKSASLEEILLIEQQIPEFTEDYREKYQKRLSEKENLLIAIYVDDQPAGYMVSYDRFDDNSFYCWMAGVLPRFRKQGLFKQMIDYLINWAQKKGYNKIKVKTRNSRREMLAYLIKYGFKIIEIQKKDDNRILFEKKI